jgi:phage baseplate assembly protein W
MRGRPPHPLGQGLGFPPRIGADGRLVWSAGEDNVREALRLILLTEPGERLMREEFGCGLHRYLLEPNTVATHQRIHDSIVRGIARWEPRVVVEEVAVVADAGQPRQVNVNIQFRLVATQATSQLGFSLQLGG